MARSSTSIVVTRATAIPVGTVKFPRTPSLFGQAERPPATHVPDSPTLNHDHDHNYNHVWIHRKRMISLILLLTSTQPTHPLQDSTWKAKEQSDEAHWARQKVRIWGPRSNMYSHALQEEEQLAKLRASMDLGPRPFQSSSATSDRRDEIEGGHGGQEDLEDRYATTSGEH